MAGVAIALLPIATVGVTSPSAAAGKSAPGDRAVGRALAQAPAAVRGYWTPARMRAAEPAMLELGPGPDAEVRRATLPRAAAMETGPQNTSHPNRVHGKVFFTVRGGAQPGDYLCSATVVNSRAHTLVWTAGHCVYDEFGGGFATNWMFVPGYRNGQRPFGSWVAEELFTTRAWREHASIRLDLGAAAVARDGEGRGIEDQIGGLGIAFSQSRNQRFAAFGYPAVPTLFRLDFDGQRLYSCGSPRTADDHPPGSGPATMQIGCDMTAGSSGGGWLTGSGLVNSVTSYRYSGDFNHLYGPYMGAAAEGLYLEARGPKLVCAGRAVTNLGGPGPQDFAGTDGDDSFRLGAGGDRATAGAGRDRVCGGRGRDVLVGGRGRDVLIGGPGRDTCAGGPGRDRARRCETISGVP